MIKELAQTAGIIKISARTLSATLLPLIYWKAEPICGLFNACSDMSLLLQPKFTRISTVICFAVRSLNIIPEISSTGKKKSANFIKL